MVLINNVYKGRIHGGGGGGGGGAQKIIMRVRTSRARSLKLRRRFINCSLKGRGRSRVFDDVSCYLSLTFLSNLMIPNGILKQKACSKIKL